MKVDKESMLLYVVTDRTWLGQNSLSSQVEETLKVGATFIQLREKSMPLDEFISEGKKIKEIAKGYNVPFVINDNIDVAIACDADGVHIGQSDMSARDVRKLIGKDKILGVSAQTVEQAIKAERDGADYIGVGAVFNTSTKKDANTVSMDTLKEICRSVKIPVVAIGGINKDNILELTGSGVHGVAVISAIFAEEDISKATSELLELSRKMVSL